MHSLCNQSLSPTSSTMDGMKLGNSASIQAWESEDEVEVEAMDEAIPKLTTESKVLLSAMSNLMKNHSEQVKLVLHGHGSKIMQAIEGLSLPPCEKTTHCQKKPSLPERSAWSEVTTVVPLPVRADNSLLTVPIEQAPQLLPSAAGKQRPSQGSVSSWTHEEKRKSHQSSLSEGLAKSISARAADLLPDFMKRDNTGLLENWRRTRRSRKSLKFESSFRRCFSQRSAQRFLSSKQAEFMVTLVIFVNSLIIGIEADWAVKHTNEDTPSGYAVTNAAFTAVFAAELLLRLFAYRKKFFSPTSKDFTWNLFDLFLVMSGIADQALALLISTPNFTVIRVLRVMRFVRLIRVVRVLRFFHDLRIIIAGIASALKSMLWAIGLLFMMMYLFSICLLQLTALEIEQMNPSQHRNLMKYYGSLMTAIYTLYQSITGGLDWADAAQPLLDINPSLAMLFCFYIAFSVLCVLNIITGVFVDNARNVCTADEEQLVIEGFESRVKWFEEVKKLFQQMVGGKGLSALDCENFIMFLDDVKVQACFRRLGIDVHETSKTGLFKLLDFNETGMVDLEEFALGLQSLHGSAKAIDLARIHCEIKKLKKDIANISKTVRGSANWGLAVNKVSSIKSSMRRRSDGEEG